MYKREIRKTSDTLVIFTILTTLVILILGFIFEYGKVTISESSFAEEVSSSATQKEGPIQSTIQPTETATSTVTASIREVEFQEESSLEQPQPTDIQTFPNESANETNETNEALNTETTPTSSTSNDTLINGNSAGAIGSDAAAQMAAATGVSQSTWEYIIARESNGNPNVSNASGASGLFQTMPGWGPTETVQDQINSAINAYNTQGMSAWGL